MKAILVNLNMYHRLIDLASMFISLEKGILSFSHLFWCCYFLDSSQLKCSSVVDRCEFFFF